MLHIVQNVHSGTIFMHQVISAPVSVQLAFTTIRYLLQTIIYVLVVNLDVNHVLAQLLIIVNLAIMLLIL